MNVRVWTASSVLGLTVALASAATPPTVISPQGIASPRPTYAWSPVAGATRYEIRVWNDTGTVLRRWYKPDVCSTTPCAATPAVTLGRDVHRWQMRARDAAGFGPWSAPLTFRVDDPVAPTLL